ncbi:MAG: glycerol acyltransferase, partial [Duncaniella sp.]|nr:glycerol acyltransferase [Duncaniella sp.]
RIDIDEVLRLRLPDKYRYIPRWLVRWLENTICQDELNTLLEHNADRTGVDFARGVLHELKVGHELAGIIPDPHNRKVILVSNHPLGGLDGLVLACIAEDIYGKEMPPRFIVNDLLDFVEPLRSLFLGVNKHGAQSRSKATAIDGAFASEAPILMFPAGLVSRRQPDGSVSDLTWHKMAVVKAISSHRDIIPVHFSGNNSQFFYKFAQLRVRLGLRFNIEMVRLPREMLLSRGQNYRVTFGSPIGWETLRGGRDAAAQAEELRNIVYALPCQK